MASRKDKISPAALRSEGVVEVGRASETSLLFVVTRSRLCLFHAADLPDRALDDYAVRRAVDWIEDGGSSTEAARNLGVNQETLRRALLAAGYERLRARVHEQLAHARAARKFGNRRGRPARGLPAGPVAMIPMRRYRPASGDSPCKECPFRRRSAAGWLGDATPQ